MFASNYRAIVVSADDEKIVVATDLADSKAIEEIRSKFDFIFTCEVQVDALAAHPEKQEEFVRLSRIGKEILQRIAAHLEKKQASS